MAITRLNTNAFGTSVNLATNVTGTLPAANGGSGRTAVTGNVLQVVHGTNTYAADYTSTSATDMLSADGVTWETSITPSSTSSKILTLETLFLFNSDTGDSTQEKRWFVHLYRKIGSGSYSAIRSSNWYGQYYYNGSQRVDLDAFSFPESKLDEPNTT